MSTPNPFDNQTPIEGVKNIIIVGSGKGGVGKSTVTSNLAMALTKKGKKVGLLDADIYGPSIPRLFGCLNQKPTIDEQQKIEPLEQFGIKLMSIGFLVPTESAVIWRGPMLFKAMDQFFRDVKWGELDYLLIDLPPGTGDVALTIAQKVPVNGAITVCTPQNLALIDAQKAVDMYSRVNIPHLGVVENMASFIPPGETEPIDLFPRGDLRQFCEANKIHILSEIPFNQGVALSCESGIPTVESTPNSLEAQAFLELADKLILRES